MSTIVTVAVRYDVKGDVDAAVRSLRLRGHYVRSIAHTGIQGDWEATFVDADVNPGQVDGFANFETFTVWAYLAHDQRRSHAAERALRRIYDDAQREDETPLAILLADRLQRQVEHVHLLTFTREDDARTDADRLALGLLQAALGRVDWKEIAEYFIRRDAENKAQRDAP